MAEKTIRITKAQRLEDIKALLTGGDVAYGTTTEIAVGVIDHELELLAKKNSTESKAKTRAAEENEVYKGLIVDYLSRLPEGDAGKTCSEIGKIIPELNDFVTSKITYLLVELKKEGRVVNEKVKGKSLYRLA